MINIVVAFPAEARPLAEYFRLRDKDTTGPFPVYRNAALCLTISGLGKVQSAAATAWLQGITRGQAPAGWLNIGIAGHAIHNIGDGFIAHRITDQASSRSWYPPQVHGLKLPTDNLLTVDLPETGYQDDALYDMEAAGFYPIACRSATAELVQCFKIVSDNRLQPVTGVDTGRYSDLVISRLGEIESLLDEIERMLQTPGVRYPGQEDLKLFTANWHFSQTQQHQLMRLLRRWEALAPGQSLRCRDLMKQNQAGDVLRWLENHLHALPVKLGQEPCPRISSR
jgi:hypothetical protein